MSVTSVPDLQEYRPDGRLGRTGRTRWLDLALSAVLAAAVVAAVALLALRLLGFQVMIERSDSMAPALQTGDLLVSTSVPVTELARGDVITFHDSDRKIEITHRVMVTNPVDKGDVRVVTKGDGNETTEEWRVPSSSAVARLVWRLPEVGRVIDALGGPVARGMSVLVLTVLAGWSVVRRIWR